MNIHSIAAYISYRWRARSRHGVHSPFAYAFVEDVIEDRKQITPLDAEIPWTNKQEQCYDRLIKRMMAYYGYTTIVNLNEAKEKTDYNVLLIDDNAPEAWAQAINSNKNFADSNRAVIIMNIHRNAASSVAWKQVDSIPVVKMTIDLYSMGVVFFKKEFMVKQHFVFKGPLATK